MWRIDGGGERGGLRSKTRNPADGAGLEPLREQESRPIDVRTDGDRIYGGCARQEAIAGREARVADDTAEIRERTQLRLILG